MSEKHESFILDLPHWKCIEVSRSWISGGRKGRLSSKTWEVRARTEQSFTRLDHKGKERWGSGRNEWQQEKSDMRKVINDGGIYKRRMTETLMENRRADLNKKKHVQIASKNLLDSTWNSAQCCAVSWMGGEFGGRMDTRVCVWLGPFSVHLKLPQHC